jgi:WD40 repeat protein
MLTQTSWTNATSFYDVDFQPNSSTILYSGMGTSANKTLLIMNASGVNSYSPTNYNNNIYAVSCAHDLSYIAIGTKKSFAIINTVSKNMDFFSNYTVAIWGVRASDDSNYVIVGTASGTIEIYKRICRICPIG